MKQMQSIACTMPEYKTLLSMDGVGYRLAPIIIAEIGDVRRFKNAKALNAYAGNDAPPYQSGQYESHNRHILSAVHLSCVRPAMKSCKA